MSEEVTLGKQALKTKHAREKILNAVISLINEGGFGAASSSKIAKRSGFTWGAVQHHFGSKEDILEAILEMSHQRFTELMETDDLTQGSLADRVERFVDRMWQHYQSDLYVAALEILLAMRGSKSSTNRQQLERQSEGHALTMRQVFGDCGLKDEQLLEVLIFVHTFLTGLIIEQVFEGKIKNEDKHLRRIKLSMLSMLTGV